MRRKSLALSLLPFLAACADFPGVGSDGLETPRPDFEEPAISERTPASLEIETFFMSVETGLLARGLLRDDGGGPDVPFTDVMLARNFEALAFSTEFSGTSGRVVRRSTPSTLHRWVEPVRIQSVVGRSVDQETARMDIAAIAAYSERLARVTGHPIRSVERGGNFHVLVLNDQELRASGPLLKDLLPELSPAEVRFVEEMSPETYCVVFASDPIQDGEYKRAIAVIRAELPDRLRTSCIHEEIAQGLGLANDSPRARPSIFNDDDEFGRLTRHDELLLQLLYDPRLRPGMSSEDASVLVREIASDVVSPTT